MTDRERAELYDHMEAVAKANGFDSLTDAIVYAVKCRDHTELEVRARRIAAIKMRLVKDPDGKKLPDDLWRQCWDEAKAEAERARRESGNENRFFG